MKKPRTLGLNKRPRNTRKMESRPRSRDEYHSARWTAISQRFRDANPYCANHLAKGILKDTEVTNHIIPTALLKDFFDSTVREPLCRACNIEQGNQDKKLIAKYRAGLVTDADLQQIKRERVERCKRAYAKEGRTFFQL